MSTVLDRRQERADARAVGELLLWSIRDDHGLSPPHDPGHHGPLLMRRAGVHGIEALVVRALAEAHQLDGLPPEVREAATQVRIRTAARYLRLSSNLAAIAKTLDTAIGEWVLMKGPVLAELGYRDHGLRSYVDLDILVSPGSFGQALDALADMGARLLDVNWKLQFSARRGQATLLFDRGPLIDLHWHPINDGAARSSTRFDVEAALSRRRRVDFATGAGMPALDSTDNLLTVALHAGLSGGHRLIWAKDLERLIALDPPNWEEFVIRAHRGRFAVCVAVMLRRSERLAGAHVPPEVIRHLLSGRSWAVGCLAVERLAGSQHIGDSRYTGRAFVSSLRDSAYATAKSLVSQTAARVRSRNMASVGENPLRREVGGPEARRAYLAAVANRSL